MNDTERIDKLFRILPFPVRHLFGGDAREFRRGIDAVIDEKRMQKLIASSLTPDTYDNGSFRETFPPPSSGGAPGDTKP